MRAQRVRPVTKVRRVIQVHLDQEVKRVSEEQVVCLVFQVLLASKAQLEILAHRVSMVRMAAMAPPACPVFQVYPAWLVLAVTPVHLVPRATKVNQPRRMVTMPRVRRVSPVLPVALVPPDLKDNAVKKASVATRDHTDHLDPAVTAVSRVRRVLHALLRPCLARKVTRARKEIQLRSYPFMAPIRLWDSAAMLARKVKLALWARRVDWDLPANQDLMDRRARKVCLASLEIEVAQVTLDRQDLLDRREIVVRRV